MPLGTETITGLLKDIRTMHTSTALTKSENMMLSISNAVKESLTDGSVTARTRDATGQHITVAYLDCVCINNINTVLDIIVLIEGGCYGGLGVIQLPMDSSDSLDLKRAYSGDTDSDNEEPIVPGTIPPFGREALTWKILFQLAVTDEPIIMRRLWRIAKDSSACKSILNPLFDSAIRSGKVQIQTVLGGTGEN
jgi:hypothetical protein